MQEKENNHVTSQLCLPPQMVPKQCSNINFFIMLHCFGTTTSKFQN